VTGRTGPLCGSVGRVANELRSHLSPSVARARARLTKVRAKIAYCESATRVHSGLGDRRPTADESCRFYLSLSLSLSVCLLLEDESRTIEKCHSRDRFESPRRRRCFFANRRFVASK